MSLLLGPRRDQGTHTTPFCSTSQAPSDRATAASELKTATLQSRTVGVGVLARRSAYLGESTHRLPAAEQAFQRAITATTGFPEATAG